MPSVEQMFAAFSRHRQHFNARRRAEWLENFVEHPFIDEPADSARRYGREHYAAIMDMVIRTGSRAFIHEPLAAIANGNELALHLRVTHAAEDARTLNIIEIFSIADCGRVAGVRAYVPAHAVPQTGTAQGQAG